MARRGWSISEAPGRVQVMIAKQSSGAAPTRVFTLAELRQRLGDWERREAPLAPLTDTQRNSWIDLHLSEETVGLAVAASPQSSPLSLAPPVGELAAPIVGNNGQLLPTQPIDGTQQFYAWFAALESHADAEQEHTFHAHEGLLRRYSGQCAELLSEVDRALTFLLKVEHQHAAVGTKTSALHDECQQLVREQTDLLLAAEDIKSRLEYFTDLDRLASKINTATPSALYDQHTPLLARLDQCIAFGRPYEFLEAPRYLARFQQLQGRALSHLKAHAIHLLTVASQSIQTQLQLESVEVGGEASFTLLHGKFRLQAPRLRPLMDTLTERGQKHPVYLVCLQECQEFYFSQRDALLGPAVATTIASLARLHAANLAALVRNGCTYVARVCHSEQQLCAHFFPATAAAATSGLDSLLERLTRIFYDTARPLVLARNVSFDVLCELCAVIQVETTSDPGRPCPPFTLVVDELLQDVRQRVVFLAQTTLTRDISSFIPTAQHLDYPAQLAAVADQSVLRTDSQAAMCTGWFPTLARGLTVLSSLYRCVERDVFQGLSQSIVHDIQASLVAAAPKIAAKAGAVHAQLFLIKHLLILREQTAPFDVDFRTTELHVDFSPLKEAARNLVSRRGEILTMGSTNAVLQFLLQGAPQVLETHVDSRAELDRALRLVCQELMDSSSKLLTAPITSFLVKLQALPATADLSTFAFTAPDAVRVVVTETDALLRSQLKTLSGQLSMYIGNADTERILLRPVKAAVAAAYGALRNMLAQRYNEGDCSIIACPTSEHVDLLLIGF